MDYNILKFQRPVYHPSASTTARNSCQHASRRLNQRMRLDISSSSKCRYIYIYISSHKRSSLASLESLVIPALDLPFNPLLRSPHGDSTGLRSCEPTQNGDGFRLALRTA